MKQSELKKEMQEHYGAYKLKRQREREKAAEEESPNKQLMRQITNRLSWKVDNMIVAELSVAFTFFSAVGFFVYIIVGSFNSLSFEPLIVLLSLIMLFSAEFLFYRRVSNQQSEIVFGDMDMNGLNSMMEAVQKAVKWEITAWVCSFPCLILGGVAIPTLTIKLLAGQSISSMSPTFFLFLLFLALTVGFAFAAKSIYSRLPLINKTRKEPNKKPFKEFQKMTNQQFLQDNEVREVSLSDERNTFGDQLDAALATISDVAVNRDIRGIKDSMTDIYAMAEKDSTVEKQIRKFSAHYMPMTVKLLNMYIDTCRKKVQTSETKKLKTEIGQMIGDVNTAFGNLNRELFEQSSVDSEVHMDALKNILESDGLLNRQEMVMPKQDEEKTEIK